MDLNKNLDNEYELIMGKVLNYLSFGYKSTYEIKLKINEYQKKIKIPQEKQEVLTDMVISRLYELNLLDDKKTLNNIFLNTLNSQKKQNKLKIRTSLMKKGFSNDDISDFIQKLPGDYEYNSLQKDFDKKIKVIKDKNKLKRYLLSKGHKYDLINKIFEENNLN